MYLRVYVCMYLCVYVYVRIRCICMYVCVYVYMYLCMHICMLNLCVSDDSVNGHWVAAAVVTRCSLNYSVRGTVFFLIL